GSQKPVCGSRKLSSTPGLAGIHPTAELPQRNRGRYSKRPPLLQRRGARPEHQDSIVPDQHSGGHVRLSAKAVFRSRSRRSRTSSGEVLGNVGSTKLPQPTVEQIGSRFSPVSPRTPCGEDSALAFARAVSTTDNHGFSTSSVPQLASSRFQRHHLDRCRRHCPG